MSLVNKLRRRQAKEACDAEARRLVLERWSQFCTNMDTVMLYVLWSEFGFGKKRLIRFFDKLMSAHADLLKRFASGEDEHYDVMRKRLKDGTGVDPVELLKKYEEEAA